MTSPASLVVGVGARRGAPADEVLELIAATLRTAGLDAAEVVELATVDSKADEPGIVGAAAGLGVPVRAHRARELARVRVPHPSGTVRDATGTPSVAEAAALIGGGELLVPKRKSAPGAGGISSVTCAVVRRPVAESMSAPPVTYGPEPFTMAAMNPPRRTSTSAGPTCATTVTRRYAATI
ncbi:hypothetical protein Sfulv_11790 [Streptomyces fulvorobeus]|uniref:CobE/GbiG C-terminal domain-containing protein n=1 Tax=Streptomyces fulvorobeus TaxID=284028 RepID=A0A7J0C1V0_9ACTN|nr:hypothetical protein Sfulv_11790 [Streptomyces fulvorobeus]